MTVTNLGPRGLGATLRGHAASFGMAAKALGLPAVDWSASKAFTFRRRKQEGVWGWEVWLQVGRLWLNLTSGSSDPAPHVRTLDEARAWAISFAARHGFAPMEVQRRRRKARPKLRLVRSARSDGGGTT